MASWANSQPIYLCTNQYGDSNLAIIDSNVTNINNYSKGTRERYYFVGNTTYNWIQVKGTTAMYRIIYIDTDDSLVLFSDNSSPVFINELTSNTLPITSGRDVTYIICPEANTTPINYLSLDHGTVHSNGITFIDAMDIINSSLCKVSSGDSEDNCNAVYNYGINTWMRYSKDFDGKSSSEMTIIRVPSNNMYKIHVKACMKITGGSGDYANPFIYENKCT